MLQTDNEVPEQIFYICICELCGRQWHQIKGSLKHPCPKCGSVHICRERIKEEDNNG
jgi:predicted RNA-binding Zn-ribbon protein involved in translation (DUF1610 family)